MITSPKASWDHGPFGLLHSIAQFWCAWSEPSLWRCERDCCFYFLMAQKLKGQEKKKKGIGNGFWYDLSGDANASCNQSIFQTLTDCKYSTFQPCTCKCIIRAFFLFECRTGQKTWEVSLSLSLFCTGRDRSPEKQQCTCNPFRANNTWHMHVPSVAEEEETMNLQVNQCCNCLFEEHAWWGHLIPSTAAFELEQ